MATHRIGKEGEKLEDIEESNVETLLNDDMVDDKEESNSSIPAVIPSTILPIFKDKKMAAPPTSITS